MNKYKRLFEQQNGKCFTCGKESNDLVFEHMIPRAYGGNLELNTLVLVCKSCNSLSSIHSFREIEFNQFISSILEKNKKYRNVKREALLSGNNKFRADIIAEYKSDNEWSPLLIELKSFPAFTSQKIRSIISQLITYKSLLKSKGYKFVLAFPGLITPSDKNVFAQYGIDVWDRNYISHHFKNEISAIGDSFYKSYFSLIVGSLPKEQQLISDLKSISPGKTEWYDYQKLVEKILDYLFSDTLSSPITELSDKCEINRRDFILRNYCQNGFWKFVRERYLADFIVLDAKNYKGKIKKNQILQISNYLKEHGTGLFAIIISRGGEENSSYLTRRERWMLENKMIIVLDDSDIEKMVYAKASSNSPEEIIKQKIEEFRLKL